METTTRKANEAEMTLRLLEVTFEGALAPKHAREAIRMAKRGAVENGYVVADVVSCYPVGRSHKVELAVRRARSVR